MVRKTNSSAAWGAARFSCRFNAHKWDWRLISYDASSLGRRECLEVATTSGDRRWPARLGRGSAGMRPGFVRGSAEVSEVRPEFVLGSSEVWPRFGLDRYSSGVCSMFEWGFGQDLFKSVSARFRRGLAEALSCFPVKVRSCFGRILKNVFRTYCFECDPALIFHWLASISASRRGVCFGRSSNVFRAMPRCLPALAMLLCTSGIFSLQSGFVRSSVVIRMRFGSGLGFR